MADLKHPLSLLNDPAAYIAWQREIGIEEAQRQMTAACRAHMAEHGPRAILDVAEKMDDATAFMEEFLPFDRLTLSDLQERAVPTRDLPDNPLYGALGLGGEAGELLNIRKKIERDRPVGEALEERREELLSEGGDVLFYLRLALAEQGFTLEEAGEYLLAKLDRMAQEQKLSG